MKLVECWPSIRENSSKFRDFRRLCHEISGDEFRRLMRFYFLYCILTDDVVFVLHICIFFLFFHQGLTPLMMACMFGR
jgi:hypothetical protein